MSEAVGERPRDTTTSSGGGGLQRARPDAASGRPGRPMVQRTRNASFAIPKMRSPSFMLREKEDDSPEANASPWGVEDDRKSALDQRSVSDRNLNSRAPRKVSLLGQPTGSGLSFSSPKRQKDTALTHSPSLAPSAKPKGIRKSMTRFGTVNEEGQATSGDMVASKNVSLSSPVSSTSPTSALSPRHDELDSDKPEGIDALGSEGKKSGLSNTDSLRNESLERDSSLRERSKAARAQQSSGKSENKKPLPRKSIKFGISSKIKSAIHFQKRDVADEDCDLMNDKDADDDENDDDEDGIALAKAPSLAADDFISYQTKSRQNKASMRKSRVLLRSGARADKE